MKPHPNSFAEKPLICRPNPELWVMVGFWAICGIGLTLAAIVFPPRPGDSSDLWGLMGVMGACFGLPVVWGALWMRLHCIIADARGLTFRGFHRRRFIAWREVEDFELRLPEAKQSSAVTPIAWLKSGGKWRRLPTILKPHEALREIIARSATSAKATDWQLAETREDGDWPKTFTYRDESGWKLVGMYLGMSFALSSRVWSDGLFDGFGPILSNIKEIWSFLSFWGRVGFATLPFLACGSYPLLILARYPAILTRRRFLEQQIKATHEGISLFRNSRRTFFRWEEIESYGLETLPGHFQPTLCVLESAGGRIEFLSNISDIKALQKLIQTRAKGAATSQWLHKDGADEDVLGGAASLYRGGIVGGGPKTYHYRTRSTRALILLSLIMLAPMLVPFFLGTRDGQPVRPDAMFGFFGACFGLPAVCGCLAFWRCWLRCEEGGLHQKGLWGERFLAWDEIHRLAFNGHYTIVSGRKRKIRFGFVADYAGLCAEIERRTGVERKRDGNAF